MTASVPLNGLGPGPALNARQLATLRELQRIKETRK